MKHIKLFESFKNKTLYRAVPKSIYYEYKDGRLEDIGRFYSTDINFANDYGDFVFEVELLTDKIFDSIEPNKIREIYDNGYTLTDDYISLDMDIEKYPTYDFENDEFPTADDFINSIYSTSDTWEVIEQSSGVLDWIMSNYDACLIYEGGVPNYYIEDVNNFIKIISVIEN